MITMSAAEFKTHCLKLLDNTYEKGETVVITKRGVPYAQLTPLKKQKKKGGFGCMAGTAEIVGDIMEPILGEWDAEKK